MTEKNELWEESKSYHKTLHQIWHYPENILISVITEQKMNNADHEQKYIFIIPAGNLSL